MNSNGLASSGRLQAPVFEFRSKADQGRPWRVRTVDLEEELSGRFSATLDLDHEDDQADPAALSSASVVLEMRRPGLSGSARRFCGVVRVVDEPYGLDGNERKRCRVKVEPAFFCLQEEILTRPFVGLTVPQILREVLGPALGIFEGREVEFRFQRPSDDASAARSFAVREFCVQYGESTYDFCRRLMAGEGLTYFFDHAGEVEKLVVVDEAQFEPAGPPLPVLPATGLTAGEESVGGLTRARARTVGSVKLKPFDYLDPQAHWDDSGAATAVTAGRTLDQGGVFDPRPGVTMYGYGQGRYQRSDVLVQTELRWQQGAVGEETLRGTSNALGLTAGHFISVGGETGLALPPWARGDFLITEAIHSAAVPEAVATGQDTESHYQNTFTLIPGRVRFRANPLPKPEALQDWALVVSAFERDPIDTDRHGRVRVQFLYDGRDDVAPDQRSSWVPVAQPWAGSGYGVQIIPRAGMLARIEYIFGDPDRPVVAECFPTGANRLPAPLPAEKSRLTLRSRSLREEGRDTLHFNEIALDDASQNEEVFLRAGRDLRRKVLNDDRTEVLHDEVHVVGRDQTLHVKEGRTKTVHGGETETVLENRHTTIEADDEHAVAKAQDGSGGKDEDNVDAERILRAKLTRTTTIVGLEGGKFGDGRKDQVEGDDTGHVTKLRRVRADDEWKAAQGKTTVVLAQGNAHCLAEGEVEAATENARLLLTPEGPAAITFKELQIVCGASQITMGSEGIRVKAPQVLVRGAQGAVKLDAAGATTTGKEITSSAKMLNELKGPLVFISDTPGVVEPLAPQKHEVTTAAGQEEQLRLSQPEEENLDLEVILLGHDLKPAANADYKLLLPTGELFQGKTDGAGKLRQKLPGVARTAELSFEPSPGGGPVCRTLALVADDSDDSPIEQLRQLGFGGDTASAEEIVREFQGMAKLEETGRVDEKTKGALASMRSGRGLEGEG